MPSMVGVRADSYNKPASGFNPGALTGVFGWWDATDASTFTFTTGDQFTQWRDKSPNARHLTATSHVNLTRSGTINGLTGVLVNHPSAEITSTISSLDILALLENQTDCMQFVVIKPNSFSFYNYAVGILNATYRVALTMTATDLYWDCPNTSGGRLTANGTSTAGTPYLIVCYRNGANMAIRRNGVQLSSKSNASGVAASEIGTFKVPANQYNFGTIGEAIHVAHYDAADLIATENYLRTKWGI